MPDITLDADISGVNLGGKTPEERAILKAEAIYNLLSRLNLPIQFSVGEVPNRVVIRITNIMLDHNCVGVELTATKGGVNLPVDDSYWFYNPPLKIKGLDGQMREDYVEVAKKMVYRAVMAYARQQVVDDG